MSSKIILDLRNFKHIKSDKGSTTLQHKSDGHSITLAHKSLSPESQAQLKALSGISKQAQTPQDTNSLRDQKMAEGGPTQSNPKLEESKKVPPKQHYAFGSDDVGGRAPAPQGTAEHDTPKGEAIPGAKQAVQGPDKQAPGRNEPVNSLDEVWERIKSAYAKGGEVAVRSMYAEGDPDVSSDDSRFAMTPPTGIAAPQPDIGGVQPTLEGKFNPNTPTSSPEDIEKMKVFDAYNQQAPGPEFKFGPNGEPPKRGVNTQVLEDQAGRVAQEDRYQAEEAREAQGAVDKANTTLHKYNIPLQNQPSGLPTVNAPGQQTGLPTLDQPQMQAQPADAGQPTPMPKEEDDMGMDNFQNMMQKGMGEQLAGIQQQRIANTQIGQNTAQALEKDAQTRQEAASAFQHNYDQLEQERQAHMQDIMNGHIDPEQYWTGTKDANGNQVGGHSKIAAGIGMILAGFNPTTSPNAAIDYLNTQMDRNIRAQEQNLGAKQNLLTANLHQFGNLRDAQDMTRIMQNDIVQRQLQLAAAKAANPAAKAAALDAAGKLNVQMAPVFQNFAMRRAVIGMANGGGSPQATDKLIKTMMLYNPDEGKMLNQAYIPGVGMSKSLSPIPEPDKQQILAMNVLDNKGRDLLQFAKAHKTDFTPNTLRVGAQKAAEMVNYYNGSINGGVLTESRLKWLDDQISKHPTNIFQDIIGNNAQLEEIINSNANRRNMLLQKNNVPIPKEYQQQQGKQQPQVKVFGGHKYIRGPNGEPVRVD